MVKDCCSGGSEAAPIDLRYREVLWVALIVNLLMFAVELAGGIRADSVSLLADAIDFMGDAANYGVSLFVLGMVPVWRSRAALIKGSTMGAYGLFILGNTAVHAWQGALPEPSTMGAIGFVALLANASVAFMLYRYRTGDANMRSVWLCSRNDAIGNLAVMLAALGVLVAGSGWPDFVVAAVMGGLAINGGYSVVRHALAELGRTPVAVAGRPSPRPW